MNLNFVVEHHVHQICTSSDLQGWYCSYVYLDGQQCKDGWFNAYPGVPGDASRVLKREDIREWVKAGGEI